ncbi:hypothetical protein PHISCL_04339 [Aspergillus sclerotialis]|uniref:Pre-rRNA-processing protein RIX1 n=1 Tax=Aspergillus sclerotialis TaxID=2070753 RepID=A0A3A2ZJ81_9EURO|nr:hypothetical protein PHISCL_04339 [Aspergillus sclerotialis]
MATTSLRAVTHRLTTTPVQELPQITSFLATSLSDCSQLLSSPQGQKVGKNDSDDTVQLHKLKTRLASLLQDRTLEGRWTAVILVKATLEAGQWEVLRGFEPIFRSLIGILAKPDPVSTKKMCIITLTRIFHLTYQYPTLVREITTPSMPAFITSVLNLVSVKPSSEQVRKLKPNTPFLETALHALVALISKHPTIFRPFSAQIHSLLVAIIGSQSSTFFSTPELDLAEQLFVSLHNCAPKNTSGEEWKNAIRLTISSIHRTSDNVFRAVVEQWESVDATLRQAAKTPDYSQEVGDDGPDPLGLPGWRGVHSGVQRLIALLRLLPRFLSTPTAATVGVPIGYILDLTARLTSVTVPLESLDPSQSNVQFNLQIGREERDSLWAELPRIHVACINFFLNLVRALESGILPAAQNILEQSLWVFRAENFNRGIRTSTYDLMNALLPLMGPSMTKQNVSSLAKVIRSCCHELLPPGDLGPSADSSTDPKAKSKQQNQVIVNADSFLNPSLKQSRHAMSSSSFPGLLRAASELLPTILNFVPTEFLSPSTRAEIDRTSILVAEKNAMLASVLNPLPVTQGRGTGSSIMPFLVRSYSGEMEVEGLVRPRMPVLMSTPDLNGYANIDEEEEEEASGIVSPGPADNTGLINTSLPVALDNSQTSTNGATESLVSNKRSYAEEPITQTSGLSSASPKTTEDVQIKKARFEEEFPNIPKPSVEQTSLTRTEGPTISVQKTSVTTTPLPTQATTSNVPVTSASNTGVSKPVTPSSKETPSASQPGQGNAETADDSDEELPTLNMDPDTDDEDEEDDVTMEG